ncbi:MAG: hypothetical protein KIT10_02845 [Flavobacteriales bacterium]|nr:hypothetical protein [Flavobacteriales bacterium]
MRIMMLFSLLSLSLGLFAQGSFDDFAYAPPGQARAVDRSQALSIMEGPLPGTLDLGLPPGTTRVDLFNSKGRLKRTMPAEEAIGLKELRPGTWTLRAHTAQGLVVRRITVLDNGSVWSMDPPRSRDQRVMRRPLD